MPDYMFFMHDDARDGENDWEPYLTKLKANGSFEGGSAIGNGVCVRKGGEVPSLTAHLTGYIRVNADDLDHARSLLAGNPHFEGNPGVATDRLTSKSQRTLGSALAATFGGDNLFAELSGPKWRAPSLAAGGKRLA
jgi:hypothetical protein